MIGLGAHFRSVSDESDPIGSKSVCAGQFRAWSAGRGVNDLAGDGVDMLGQGGDPVGERGKFGEGAGLVDRGVLPLAVVHDPGGIGAPVQVGRDEAWLAAEELRGGPLDQVEQAIAVLGLDLHPQRRAVAVVPGDEDVRVGGVVAAMPKQGLDGEILGGRGAAQRALGQA